jgi:integrase
MEEERPPELTEKNLALIRQARTPGVWSRVTKLPYTMIKEARSRLDRSPVAAAVMAQLAVAIAILTVAPVRLANLTNIRLGFNLTKPHGPDSNYWLRFPDYDVKNRVRLEFPLSDRLTALIDEYVNDMRPVLMRGYNGDYLFPGLRGGAKQSTSFSGQITKVVEKATGLRVTVHQFRHAAGAVFLKHRPGEYEMVRQLLGHRTLETTKRFYLALEGIDASILFNEMIEQKLGIVTEDD